jgi:hypothetical protein
VSQIKPFVKGFRKGMEKFGLAIAVIVNTILLFFVYLAGVGFTSLFGRLAGKRFLETSVSAEEETYWSGLDLKKKPIDEYYRQF